MIGAGAGARAAPGFFWRARLVAGLQVGQALGCSGHVPGHPTSICDMAVIGIKTIAVLTMSAMLLTITLLTIIHHRVKKHCQREASIICSPFTRFSYFLFFSSFVNYSKQFIWI